MELIKLDKVKKYYGDRVILDIENFKLFENDRIGLVGENGVGKSTLIKAIIGDIEIDSGNIQLTSSYSYISQLESPETSNLDPKLQGILNTPDSYNDYLSGGEKVKLKLTQSLSENSKLIIADEPTANLDLASIEKIKKLFKVHTGALLLVSHDRDFLDSLCTTIIELKEGKIKSYPGNYTKYLELKEAENLRFEVEYTKYVNEKNKIENAILTKENKRDSIRKAPRRMGNSEARLHKMGDQRGKKNIDGNVKALKSRLAQLEIKEKSKTSKEIKISIHENLVLYSKNPIEANNLTLYAGDKLLLKDASFKLKRNKKIALIGENGTGKSTLIKEIMNNKNESIKISPSVVIGYFDQNQDRLNHSDTILDNIKVNSSFDDTFIRINLDNFGFKGDRVFEKVEHLSGGERVKVALCKVLLSDNNILILDEPTNYLDIESMVALEKALINTEKTLLIVSHDIKLISNVCNYIFKIDKRNITAFNGSYNDYLDNINKPKINNLEKENKEKLLLLQTKLSEVISLLSIEKDEKKLINLDKEYYDLLTKINKLKYN